MLDELKKLINGELVAAIQYKIAAQALTGSENFNYIKEHCEEHSQEEFEHYEKLVDALMQRGETPDINLSISIDEALPLTEELRKTDTSYIRKFFSNAEANAIEEYSKFHDLIKDEDPGLDDIIVGIMEDEREHKLDFDRIAKISPTLEAYRNKHRAKRIVERMIKTCR